MTSLLEFLSLFSALATTSYALSCISCGNLTSPTCTGSSVTCPLGSMCASSLLEFTIDDTTFKSYIRGCSILNKCDTYEVAYHQFNMNVATTCCSTDDCTPSVPSFARSTNVTNGLVCPSCISLGSYTCDSPYTVECRGSEDRCLFTSLEIKGDKGSIIASSRSCTTQSVCDLIHNYNSEAEVTDKITYECTNGATSVQAVFLPAAVTCLLMLKWLF
ncbi:phospholipase A2 inhibitor gamma subunit B-like [Engystomops pustulosus]|uniref:phospholipase A2 inhibitor gamma subunit B-like n=1 Tax=Engystomops pustulosus TaxID=76066 RepID=UPI003AFB2AC5